MFGSPDEHKQVFLVRKDDKYGEIKPIETNESFYVFGDPSLEADTASVKGNTQDIRVHGGFYPKPLRPPQSEPGSLAPFQKGTVSRILNADVSGELKKKKYYMARNRARQRMNRRQALKAACIREQDSYIRANGPSRLQGGSGVTMSQNTPDKDFPKYRTRNKAAQRWARALCTMYNRTWG
ncbi:hypothetical protein FOQG_14663 [Fusarium oxysporum f. sp. raphani 54005]|uniref:Uncharacterized protein n=2 Tax=Fusarium oxysporum TaxID=5507 RepID=X0BGF3_FUSOX|nr:hypothetical protein FOMG_18001 [Fusarium oxysporum f. sp. melonis 26406]EXK80891.1 hypothetical protein FOQG_14663 [Fusarium oxysporum f. sp. raphani 54005]